MLGIASKILGGGLALAVLGIGVQTVRIEGFLFVKGYKAQVAGLKKNLEDMRVASKIATEQQIALNDARTNTETKNAEIDDVKFEAAQGNASNAATVYIDRFRVRPERVCPGTTDSTPQGSVPVVPEALPAAAVMVSEDDVRKCTSATAYAIAAHNSAVTDVADGTAEFLPAPASSVTVDLLPPSN
jgi:hypothetical protein